MMMKTAIAMMLFVALLAAASSVSAERGLDFQNVLNLEAKEAERQPQKVSLSIGNKKVIHLVTLPWDHCVPQGDPCGILDWCCGSLRCRGVIPGQEFIYGSCA